MKKRHLLSLLALGISTACYGESPLVRRSRISVA